METRRSNDHKLRDMASALEDSLVEATENLLDLLEFERVISEAVPAGRSSLESAHIQVQRPLGLAQFWGCALLLGNAL